jgi:hypothetical protein
MTSIEAKWYLYRGERLALQFDDIGAASFSEQMGFAWNAGVPVARLGILGSRTNSKNLFYSALKNMPKKNEHRKLFRGAG